MEDWRSGSLEARGRYSDVDVWCAERFGVLEARCKCSGITTQRYGGPEVWSRVASIVILSCGALELRRSEGVKMRRYGGMETSCKCGDVDVWMFGGLEARRWEGALQARRCGGMEVWRRAARVLI